MTSIRAGVIVLFMIGATFSAAQSAPPSRCAGCHFANPGSTSLWHLSEWDNSAHGRKSVGCEGCHGGDPTTFDSFLAHRGIVKATQFGSPLHSMNIPKTCGSCHPGPFEQFEKSKHYELLRQGNRDAPTCVTCHGTNGAYLPSPKALASECARCHGAGKIAPHTDRPAEARMNLARVREIRDSLDASQRAIRGIRDAKQRQSLDAQLQDARAALTAAIHSAHAFVFDEMHERLDGAAQRADRLAQVVGPTRRK